MSHGLATMQRPPCLASFDDVVARYGGADTSFTETEALRASHWEMGEDARLREDHRFRQTPWGRWMLAENLLANHLHSDRALPDRVCSASKQARTRRTRAGSVSDGQIVGVMLVKLRTGTVAYASGSSIHFELGATLNCSL